MPAREPGRFDGDPVALASALALLSAVAALEYPPFVGLTLVLVALGVGAYLVSYRRRNPGPMHLSLATGLSFLSLAAGGALAVSLPAPLAAARGIPLALGLLPLWWTARGSASIARRSA